MSGEFSSPTGGNPEAIFAQSMSAFQKGDLDRAMRHADRLLETSEYAGAAVLWAIRLRLESRRWEEAISLGNGHLDKAPGISGLVAQAYESMGKLDEAERMYARAAQEQPDNPGWHYHRASVLSRLYRDYESLGCLRVATQLAPDKDGQLILAALELNFANPSIALAQAEKAIQMDPKNEGGYVVAAKSLMATGRMAEADDWWRQAEPLGKEKESIPLQRAIALVRHGDFSGGISALEEIVERSPKFLPAYVQIATNKKIGDEDRPFIEALKQFEGDKSIGETGEVALNFALGKAHDNLREYEAAMRYFDAGNRLQYRAIGETGGFDREGYAANMALRTRVFSHEVVAEQAAKGDPSEAPIFVLGMIRSGTTLAEQIISSHPMVVGAGEQDFWINADLRLIDYANSRLELENLREAARTYLRLLGEFSKGKALRVVDKQPGNLILAGALHIAYPNARIIHMRRHPVDTAVSIWTTHIQTTTRFVNDKGNIAHAFRQHERLMRHWREVIPADRFLDVSYEELIVDREKVTREMLEFCNLPWDDVCLSPEKNQKLVITPSLWQVRQPIYRTSMERWRNYEPWLGDFRQLFDLWEGGRS
jgi:tetratricopeptide (TPR) repeat protein